MQRNVKMWILLSFAMSDSTGRVIIKIYFVFLSHYSLNSPTCWVCEFCKRKKKFFFVKFLLMVLPQVVSRWWVLYLVKWTQNCGKKKTRKEKNVNSARTRLVYTCNIESHHHHMNYRLGVCKFRSEFHFNTDSHPLNTVHIKRRKSALF